MKGHVLDYRSDLAARFAAALHVGLFLDFDGTLAPLQDDPDMVRLAPPVRRRLQQLAAAPDRHVAIVSGRELTDLQRRVGVTGIVYAGNHGLEISGPDCAFVEPTAVAHRGPLKNLIGQLTERLQGITDVRVEDKTLTASVHYRQAAPEVEDEVRRLVHQTLAGADHPFVLMPGAKVFDIRPRVYWNKGTAVDWIRQHAVPLGALMIYVGDDATDEDAFAILPDDITIKVGPAQDSAAHYFVDDPDQVADFLAWLAADPCRILFLPERQR